VIYRQAAVETDVERLVLLGCRIVQEAQCKLDFSGTSAGLNPDDAAWCLDARHPRSQSFCQAAAGVA